MAERYPVPDPEQDFGGEGEGDFILAPKLQNAARLFLSNHPEFDAIRPYEPQVKVLWKQAGGTGGGKNTLGKCTKTNGILKFFANEYDFVIWLAADHLQHAPDDLIEAVLFHELCHIGVNEKTGAWVIQPHDLEEFASVVREYGKNTPGIHGFARAVQRSFLEED